MQVDLAPPSIDDEGKHLTGKNVPGSVKLKRGLDEISAHWPATTPLNPRHLHIIVEISLTEQDEPRESFPLAHMMEG
jgi:hypothetical protein